VEARQDLGVRYISKLSLVYEPREHGSSLCSVRKYFVILGFHIGVLRYVKSLDLAELDHRGFSRCESQVRCVDGQTGNLSLHLTRVYPDAHTSALRRATRLEMSCSCCRLWWSVWRCGDTGLGRSKRETAFQDEPLGAAEWVLSGSLRLVEFLNVPPPRCRSRRVFVYPRSGVPYHC
jgi:hypothetical protein